MTFPTLEEFLSGTPIVHAVGRQSVTITYNTRTIPFVTMVGENGKMEQCWAGPPTATRLYKLVYEEMHNRKVN